MKLFFIILIVVSVIGAVAYLIYKRINKKIDDTILETSPKIAALLKLNETVDFHVIPPCFSVSKHYDNKGYYNKIDPAYIMTAEVRQNIPYYSDYVKKIHENREIQKRYAYFLCRAVSFGGKSMTEEEIEDFHLSTLRLTYEEALAEYERRKDTRLGRLIAAREIPVLTAAAGILARLAGEVKQP